MSAESSGRNPLVEIVPNFSEGRRQDVIDAILAASRVPGVRMLTWQADPDHNRLDASLVGSPEAVRRSALAAAAKAAELIDMDQQRGSHPRMGAVDVIPFLPIRDLSMEDCVALARDVGKEIADSLGLPVYLYDQAALLPERSSLAVVRKGEYEGLKADVAEGKRLPDYGPHEIGKAGAVAVGARKPLIAFNVYLNGADEDAAKQIARAVRESTGGLKNVRSIGFFVEERGAVTVSMNLVDTDATPIYRALELVKLEASRFGLSRDGHGDRGDGAGIRPDRDRGLLPSTQGLRAGRTDPGAGPGLGDRERGAACRIRRPDAGRLPGGAGFLRSDPGRGNRGGRVRGRGGRPCGHGRPAHPGGARRRRGAHAGDRGCGR